MYYKRNSTKREIKAVDIVSIILTIFIAVMSISLLSTLFNSSNVKSDDDVNGSVIGNGNSNAGTETDTENNTDNEADTDTDSGNIETDTDNNTDNSIVGTWVFNDELTPLPDVQEHEMTFCDKEGTIYRSIIYSTIGPPVCAINYLINDGVGAGYPYVFPAENMYGFTAGWKDEKYKTITITEEPTDEVVKEWLRANAVKQPKPLAYHLSSVDELPSNAIDGSLAIVDSVSEILGTWVFNDEIALDTNVEASINFSFVKDGETIVGNRLRYASYGPGVPAIWYCWMTTDGYDSGVATYWGENIYGMSPIGWQDENYKTITITGYKYYNEGFISWLHENATLSSGVPAQYLYSRENGEWVCKGEI